MLFNKRNCCGAMPEMPMYDGCCGKQEMLITEPTMTNCIEREFFHEVPHVCPMHTHECTKK